MKRIVCFHCGEHYEAKRLVCPHCGADREFTYGETPTEALEDEWSGMDDRAYQVVLEREGLAPRPRLSAGFYWWGLLAFLSLSGLIWLLL